MKKLLVFLLSATLCCCLICASACRPTYTGLDARYNGGEVQIGATLDKSLITVTARYGDGTEKRVDDYELSYDFSSAGDKTVIVKYTEGKTMRSASFKVTVAAAKPDTPALTHITAVYNGGDIYVGGILNNSDITVTAFYDGGGSKAVTSFSVGNFSSAVAGECVVNVSYGENGVTKQTTFTVNIVARATEVADYGDYGLLQKDGSVKIVNTATVNGELQIHFLAVTNNSPGDSIFIKAGDVDILIDAGSTTAASTAIPKYLADNNLVTDNKLEFVIATHSDNDHIAGLAGSGESNGILDKYQFDTIITYAGYYTDKNGTKTATQTRFENKCQALAEKGVNVFTALECYNNSAEGAQRVYKLTDNIEMEVLYNYYYDHSTSNNNNYSVCLMFNQYGDGYDFEHVDNPNNKNYVNHFLFTGDLENEKGEAEDKLVQYNNLPNVVLFKGGHHGSKTSSNIVLMDKILPKVVCVCTCCGEGRYGFPAQEFIDRTALYTDMVFMTNQNVAGASSTPLNGNIVVTSNSDGVFINCSNNNTLFKDTDWFKQNRTCPPQWKNDETEPSVTA